MIDLGKTGFHLRGFNRAAEVVDHGNNVATAEATLYGVAISLYIDGGIEPIAQARSHLSGTVVGNNEHGLGCVIALCAAIAFVE
jgi:hypothetical protein